MQGRFLTLYLGLGLIGIVTQVQATTYTVTFDEFGHGAYQQNGGGSVVSDPGFIDPSGFLTYALPNVVNSGDVGIAGQSSCSSPSNCSDGLRFYTFNGVSFMEFFSIAGGGALADTGFPSNFGPVVTVTETTQETFAYTGASGNVYDGASSVPEPASLAIFGTALAGLGLIRRRRRRNV